MPFFATTASGPTSSKTRATRGRAHSPTPAPPKTSKAPSDYQTSKPQVNKQQARDSPSRDHYYSDCDSRSSESEKTFVDIKNYLVDFNNHTQMPAPRTAAPDRDRSDYGRQERDRPNRPGPPRSQPTRQSADADDILHIDLDEVTNRVNTTYLGESQPFPITSIYEQILILRQHGAVVKFSPKSRSECLRDELPRSVQTIRRGGSPVSFTDVVSPSREEINAVDHALASVINTGGEVEFQPLFPRQGGGGHLECGGCSKVFAMQQDRDEHIGGGSLKCSTCGIGPLYCRGLMEEHMHKKHRARTSSGLTSPNYANFSDSNHDRNESQPWNYHGPGTPKGMGGM